MAFCSAETTSESRYPRSVFSCMVRAPWQGFRSDRITSRGQRAGRASRPMDLHPAAVVARMDASAVDSVILLRRRRARVGGMRPALLRPPACQLAQKASHSVSLRHLGVLWQWGLDPLGVRRADGSVNVARRAPQERAPPPAPVPSALGPLFRF